MRVVEQQCVQRADMSTVIKSGTIVTADLTYEADVLIENGRIAGIGPGGFAIASGWMFP